jgi:hypothetical protein
MSSERSRGVNLYHYAMNSLFALLFIVSSVRLICKLTSGNKMVLIYLLSSLICVELYPTHDLVT